MIWQRARASKNTVYSDVDDVGRYMIRWGTDDHEYRAFLNGKRTTYAAKTVRDVQAMVEHAVAALDQIERDGVVTMSFPEIRDGDDG